MSLLGGNCFNGNDTILWFIILFLLIFCNNGVGGDDKCCYEKDYCKDTCC